MSKAEQQTRIRKIMIYALNAALRAGVIPLKTRHNGVTETECAEITVCGKPTIINWCDTGHNDLRISVWWDYRPERLPKLTKNRVHDLTLPLPGVYRDRLRLIVGLCASCYFNRQRKRGVLSDKGNEFFSVYVRESTASYIDEQKEVKPFGYSISELSRSLLKNDFTTSRR
ncbi:TPA: hypothetical protein O7W39_003028 [Salmonella enterica]|uniref:Uncharacterized protein n=1 Tax=Salmonella enterica subsp. diarizonae serovar Rough:r:z TaxID=1974321 RepID=A0A7Z0Y5K9_SALDZ|nr:hypothetical protein [Salmonella enterica]EAM2982028.1 hypothetical protein [Salmonella enterica]EBS7186484.1 hypothetical protein [Salmonella enterica]EFS2571985.1 hypothetical protein [Salmonella enterica]EMD8593612.1 hypothetical protein [Salmonella enterica]OSG81614.1 hypothetical protein R545_14270 [Salmonella enterica subsp. diarizonae serovar Rough:r:z]